MTAPSRREGHPQLTTWPLPQELKDQIYSYLLHADHVKVARDEGLADKYAFQTAILRVNKQIGTEAKEYLYKNNRMVLLKHDVPSLNLVMYAVGAHHNCIVSGAAEILAGHCLDIEITWTEPPGDFAYYGEPEDEWDGRGALLMQISDLLMFMPFLGLRRQSIKAPGVYVSSVADGKTEFSVEKSSSLPTISVSANTSSCTPLAQSEQSVVLDSLHQFVGCDINIVGFEPSRARDVLENGNAHTLAWPLALGWNLYEAALWCKLRADEILRSSDPRGRHGVYWLYNLILIAVSQANADGITLPSSGHAHDRCFEAEIHGSLFMAAFGVGEYATAAHGLSMLLEHHHHMPNDLKLRIWHFQLSLTMIATIVRDDQRKMERLRLCEILEKLKAFAPFDSRIAHDRDLLRAALHKDDQAEHVAIDPHSLSICALPLEPFDYHRDLDLPSRPANLVGRQDLTHLHSLTTADREEINRLQMQHGLPVTNFEE